MNVLCKVEVNEAGMITKEAADRARAALIGGFEFVHDKILAELTSRRGLQAGNVLNMKVEVVVNFQAI